MSIKKTEKENAYWISSISFFAFQFIVIVLFSQRLVRETSILALLIPIFVFALFIGLMLRKKIAFLIAFIWSIVLVVHSFALVFVEFKPLQIIYVIFAIAQAWCLSQVEMVN